LLVNLRFGRARTKKRAKTRLPKPLFFYTVSAFMRVCAKARPHRHETPFIIAKDDSWKIARKARLG
ncbi:MAG: hypothetical protein V4793_29345, partial [Paraburkholderia tropica]